MVGQLSVGLDLMMILLSGCRTEDHPSVSRESPPKYFTVEYLWKLLILLAGASGRFENFPGGTTGLRIL
jgi:hypothetical protein